MKGKTIVFRRMLAVIVPLVTAVIMSCGIIPGGVLEVHAEVVNLGEVTDSIYYVKTGDVLTGTLDGVITVYDGVKEFTLKDATIQNDYGGGFGYANAAIICRGSTTIKLEGNNTVISSDNGVQGIWVNMVSTLTITGGGTLTVKGGSDACGIGGGEREGEIGYYDSGNIVIKSGTITAIGGYGCPGIGQGQRGYCGTITINGGNVTAYGGYGAAGIGAAYNTWSRDNTNDVSCGDITITGGTVYAYGGDGGAGIGSGYLSGSFSEYKSVCGNISITGGRVFAYGGKNAAGIGSGDTKKGAINTSVCGTINVSGTDTLVSAYKGEGADNHIGAGLNSTCGTLTIAEGLTEDTSDTACRSIYQTDKIIAEAAPVTCQYDGKAHGITVNVVNPKSDATVRYGRSEGEYNLDKSPSITDVNDSPLKVYYQVTKAGYADYTGSAQVIITKADQDAPAAPAKASVTETSITLAAIDNGEYKCGKDGTWQDSNVFEELTWGNTYKFYQRYKEDDNHNASPDSVEASITLTHVHDWSYQAEGAVLTATCGNTDGAHLGEARTATLTLNAPAHNGYNDGYSKEVTVTGSIEDVVTPEVEYKRGQTPLAAAPTDAGRYTASITLGDATATLEYEIEGLDPFIDSVPSASAITYGQALSDSNLTGGTADIAGVFTWKDGSIKPSAADSNVTEYDVVFTPSVANYKRAECKVKLAVNKAAPAVTAPTAKNLKYNGAGQELINAGSVDGGTMYYAVGTISEAAPLDSSYKTDIPKAKEVGTYYVWYKVAGDENHNDAEAVSLGSITIDEAASIATTCTHPANRISKTDEVSATCTTAGSSAYYICNDCGKYFSDAQCTKEIAKDSWIESAIGHNFGEWKIKKQPTETEEGVEERVCRNDASHIETRSIARLESKPVTGEKDNPSTGNITTPDTTETPAPKNTTLTDESTKATFTVTSSAGEEPTVEYKASTRTTAKTVTIPATIIVDGVTYKVTEIADRAFADNKTVEKIVISKNIESIGDGAFSGCTKLKSVSIPAKVTEIGDKAFKGCTSLTSIKTGNGVTKIGNSAFEGCKKLKSVTIGSKVTEIGDSAFANCPALTKVTLPAKVTKIGKNVFKGDKKLKTITIKSTKLTEKSVSKNAFKGVGSKVTIIVPKKMKKAYTKLFRNKGLSKNVKIK